MEVDLVPSIGDYANFDHGVILLRSGSLPEKVEQIKSPDMCRAKG